MWKQPSQQIPRRMLLIAFLAIAQASQAQTVRVIRFAEGKPFQMGKVTSRRIVHPDIGAKRTTLNYSVSVGWIRVFATRSRSFGRYDSCSARANGAKTG